MHSGTMNDEPAWARALREAITEIAAWFGLYAEAQLINASERARQEIRAGRRRFTFPLKNFPRKWPVTGANSHAEFVSIAPQGQRSQADPMLVEVIRFLARRAARQWFAHQMRTDNEDGE